MRKVSTKSLKGTTVAVFGASSNIGSKFVNEAAKRGVTIVAVARNTKKLSSYKNTVGDIEIIHGDITKPKDVWKALSGRNINATINFAADFSGDISRAKTVNVEGEKNILDATAALGIKRHIYISTIAIQIPKPNVYGDTKRLAEEVVKKSGKSLAWIILRYAHVLGSRTWDQPFKLRFPFGLAIPKLPTDADDVVFPYLTIETAIEATLAALFARPNQVITVFDGKITIGKYLAVMEKVYGVRMSFLPNQVIQILNTLVGRFLPFISSMAATLDFMANPPAFENKTMRKELQIETRDFDKWIKIHFANESSF